MVTFVRNCSVKLNFEAVLATYDHDANASEAVQKIPIDQKEYQRYSSCVIIY